MQTPHTAILYAYGEDGPDWGGRPQQIQRCQAYATRHRLQVLELVEEPKWAGTTLTRPAFGRLFTALTTMPTPPSCVLVTTLDRIGRRNAWDEGPYIEWRLRGAGISVIDVDATDGRPAADPIDGMIRSIRLAMEQEYRREEARYQIQFASRVDLYCHFLANGGWPAVHAVDGTVGFGYRRWQCVTPGYYQPAADDLPTGDGVLLPGPVDELQEFQRVYLAIRQAIYSSAPLDVHLSQHLGEDWTPSRAAAVMTDATLCRIGIPGWEVLTPAQHACTLEWVQEAMAEHR